VSNIEKLKKLLTDEVIPDVCEAIDEIFESIADNKEATDDEKEEIEELQEFKADLEDILEDIKNNNLSDEEAHEILSDILEAMDAKLEN